MRDKIFIDRQLRRYALERYRRFGSMSLPQFNSSVAIFRALPDSFLEFLTQYRTPVLDWLNSCIPRSETRGAGNDALPFLVDSMTYCIEKKNQFMEVLKSLKPGGSFIYAPGMPFMEDLLPGDNYYVSRFPLSALAGTPIDISLQARLRKMVLYSCRVTRLPKP